MTSKIFSALAVILISLPAFLQGADKGTVLVEQYRLAHEAKDPEALRKLVYWEGSSERTREIIGQRLIRYLDLRIKKIAFRPLTGEENFENLGYRPNIEPVGWLAIFFIPPEQDSRFFGKSFVVGEKNGKYWITVAVPIQ